MPQLCTPRRIQRPPLVSDPFLSLASPEGPAFCDNSMLLAAAAAAVVHAAQDRAGQGPHATHLARLPCCHSHLNSFLSPSPPRCLLHPAPCSKQSATVLCTYVRGLSLSLSLSLSALSLDSLPTLRKKNSSRWMAFCNLQTSFWNACMEVMTKERIGVAVAACMDGAEPRAAAEGVQKGRRMSGQGDGRRSNRSAMHACMPTTTTPHKITRAT